MFFDYDLISNSQSSSWSIAWMRQWGVNNLPKVVAQQRHGRGSNPQPRPLDRKSDALSLSHCAMEPCWSTVARFLSAKYGRLSSIRDVCQGQYDAISYVCMCLFRCTVTMAVSVAVCEIFSTKEWCDFEHRVRVRSRSLEIAPFDRSHTSSYSPFIVTMAVSLAISEIFSVKEWPDFKKWVWGCSRSLKMARFDRPCMTFY